MSRSDRRHYRENERSERRNESRRSERDFRSEKKHHESRGSASYERRQERRRTQIQQNFVNRKEIEENQNAIRAFKENVVTCEICGEAIADIASAISNRGSENPVHFDCVLKKLAETEKPSPSEKITYIGQGKFALLYFSNPHDQKHFSIRKTIEWEARDTERGNWRNEMAGLFSQVK